MLDSEFFVRFGLNVKMYRLKSGLTQAELGEIVNMSEHRISQIECGKCNLTLKTVNKLSNALNIRPKRLFYSDDDE